MNITENMRGNFVALHILRPTVAVNLNAGKDGTPKSIRYGGVVRQRVSSQAIKRAIRVSMRERLNDEDTARRTKGIPGAVADQVMHLARRSGDELDRDDVQIHTALALSLVGYEPSIKYGDPDSLRRTAEMRTEAEGTTSGFAEIILEAISDGVFDDLAEIVSSIVFSPEPKREDGETAKKFEERTYKPLEPVIAKAKSKNMRVKIQDQKPFTTLQSRLKNAIEKSPNIEIATMGRFLASSREQCVDSTLSVAHAISVDSADMLTDFWSAVDDNAGLDFADGRFGDDDDEAKTSAGGAHIGEATLASGTLYEFIVLDRATLRANLRAQNAGDETITEADIEAEAVRAENAALSSALTAVPRGHNNGTGGAGSPASYVLAVTGNGQPISAVSAFESPVVADADDSTSAKAAQRIVDTVARHGKLDAPDDAVSVWLADGTGPTIADSAEWMRSL